MGNEKKENVYKVYDKIASWFSKNRNTALIEKEYLDDLIKFIPAEGNVLDLGCGTGKPILQYLISKKINVTGLDASKEMLCIAEKNFPETEFLLQDMRFLNLNKKFDAIIAWHSFFYLPIVDQPIMFKCFKKYLNPKGIILFTSGTELGEKWGVNGGENLFHDSLSTDMYAKLLKIHNFKVLRHVENDPNCGNATIWMARYTMK
ncbi:ubiquinone/menaquinone biosynthesis C-methylase UbiE [Pedobacter sp. CAN_A7]|uniref:class I SAM-dependent DNA methyltransferase n=1 Tax=Pedobacter sp. CAN_A7 TaxID=2787722 RepID=UPI0018CA630E